MLGQWLRPTPESTQRGAVKSPTGATAVKQRELEAAAGDVLDAPGKKVLEARQFGASAGPPDPPVEQRRDAPGDGVRGFGLRSGSCRATGQFGQTMADRVITEHAIECA